MDQEPTVQLPSPLSSRCAAAHYERGTTHRCAVLAARYKANSELISVPVIKPEDEHGHLETYCALKRYREGVSEMKRRSLQVSVKLFDRPHNRQEFFLSN